MWGSIILSARPGGVAPTTRVVESYDMTDPTGIATPSAQGLALVTPAPGSVSVHMSGGTNQAPLSGPDGTYIYGTPADWLAVDAQADGSMLVELGLQGQTLGSVMLTAGLVVTMRHDRIKVIGVTPYVSAAATRIMMGSGVCPLQIKAQHIQGQAMPVAFAASSAAGVDVYAASGVNTLVAIGDPVNRVLTLTTITAPMRLTGGYVTCALVTGMTAEIIASAISAPTSIANSGASTSATDQGAITLGVEPFNSALTGGTITVRISEARAAMLRSSFPGSTIGINLRTRGPSGVTWGSASSVAWSFDLAASAA